MTIYTDENIPHYLAEGFNTLIKNEGLKTGSSIEVKSIEGRYGKGIKDEDWIPELGQEGAVVITRDFNIARRKHQLELCKKHGLSVIFIQETSKKNGLSVMEIVALLAKNWHEIQKITLGFKPFLYQINRRGKIEELPV